MHWISQNGTHFETYFNCEAQQHFSDDDKKRVYYYEASQYTAQIKRGQSYKNIMPVTTLIFAHTASFARDNGHYIQTLPRYTDDWHYDEQEPEAYKVLVVLSRVPESTLTLKTATPSDNFLYFMKKTDTLSAEEFKTLWNKGDPMLRKAAAEYANTLDDNKEFFEKMKDLKIDLRFDQIRIQGEEKGRAEGLAEGLAKGEARLRQQLVASMFSQGLDQAFIRQTLGLTEKELAHIVEERESVEIS